MTNIGGVSSLRLIGCATAGDYSIRPHECRCVIVPPIYVGSCNQYMNNIYENVVERKSPGENLRGQRLLAKQRVEQVVLGNCVEIITQLINNTTCNTEFPFRSSTGHKMKMSPVRPMLLSGSVRIKRAIQWKCARRLSQKRSPQKQGI